MQELHDAVEGALILGIDLGTTKSGVAVWSERDGRAVMLRDAYGHDTIPSVVAWDRAARRWIVGRAAKAMLEHRPADVAYSVKRFIGRPFSDPVVRAGHQDVTYALVGGGGSELLHDVLVDFGRDENSPALTSVVGISTEVLRVLRHTAARALGLPLGDVEYAVVTVPAYFDVRQRRATIRAGQDAGLKVVGILNEPTAAALAHTAAVLHDEGSDGHAERTILVYDLGGGTFDVSLLDMARDSAGYQFFTRVVNGDTRLGGDDIDAALARHFAEEIQRHHGHGVRDDDAVSRSRLRLAAERAKIALTTLDRTTVALRALDIGSCAPFDVELKVTRAELERCAADVIRRAQAITRLAVEQIERLSWDEIDEVILVGGPAVMPAIQRDVALFTGKPPRVSDRPHTAIALGAAEYGHILSLGRARFAQNALSNVVALSLGVRLTGDVFRAVVEANRAVPHQSSAFAVTTTADDQTVIDVEVLQGPAGATRVAECVSLGTIHMEVPPAPAGRLHYDVRFEVESDGTLQASVTDPRRQRVERLVVGERRDLLALRESVPAGG